jgi:hypothetical protein
MSGAVPRNEPDEPIAEKVDWGSVLAALALWPEGVLRSSLDRASCAFDLQNRTTKGAVLLPPDFFA